LFKKNQPSIKKTASIQSFLEGATKFKKFFRKIAPYALILNSSPHRDKLFAIAFTVTLEVGKPILEQRSENEASYSRI
jgi:hypothetical protein